MIREVGNDTHSTKFDVSYEYILHASPIASCVVAGPTYRCEFVNDAFQEQMFPGMDVVGKNLVELISFGWCHDLKMTLDRTWTTETHEHLHGIVVEYEGYPLRVMNVSFAPLRDSYHRMVGVLIQAIDVTQYVVQKDVIGIHPDREAIPQHTHQYQTMMDHYPNGALFLFDHDLRYTVARGAAMQTAGVSSAMFEGKTIWEIWPTEIAERDAPFLEAALCGKPSVVEVNHGERTVEVQTLPVKDGRGDIIGGMVVTQDISERKRVENALRESEARFRQLAESIYEVFWLYDVDANKMLFVSQAYDRMWGRSGVALLSGEETLMQSVHPDDLVALEAAMQDSVTGGFDEEFRIMRPDGAIRWLHARLFPISDEMGRVCRLAGVAEDVTARKEVEEELRQQALYDPLTKLPNRTLLFDRLERVSARTQRYPDMLSALLFLDLDDFKSVNDTYGHIIGDELLVEVASRLEACIRPGDTVARLGGDEFVILLEDIEGIVAATKVGERVIAALTTAITVQDRAIQSGVSIGIALSGAGLEPRMLLHHADAAMYASKAAGRARYTIYDQALHELSLASARLARVQSA